ncbi:MAG TPA: methyl-accepting chemotaxis protein [Oligoflexus sp.]|uniref:HAMP domain-containing methyl-accepting chemotaxis protein n=1 Tax=Oligoflexus sp. TaxID=1971216 RepID=UPI002D3EABA0|nr:methyl-accepting chemotaxis protein [Oligoflexus sp.]HYX37666.1 methyl-accepting chemotaxis protein [Oligoflexus sp.]
MFNSWSLKAKLIGAFSFCATILAFVGGISYFRLNEVVFRYDHVVKNNMGNYIAVSNVLDATRRLNIMIGRLTNSNLTVDQLRTEEAFLAQALSDIDAGKKAYLAIPFVDGEDSLYQPVDQSLAKVIEFSKRVLEMSRTNDPESLKKRDEFAYTYDTVRVPYREAMDRLKDFQSREADKWSKSADSAASSATIMVLSLVTVGVIISFVLGLFISTSITKTMLRVSDQLSSGADEVTSAASEISSTSEQLSASATEQASSLQETASSIEEMSSMIKQNSDNANRSSETARSGQQSVDKGKHVISEMLDAMNSIDAANKEISEVVKVIGQIANKTKVIDDIVFKTQLLSFNASVEAARAGEHGKGFAVVAEEVGNLAQMSGNAAREISDMLEQSLERVERMITTSKQKVEVGINVGKRCGDVLDELVVSVGDVNGMAGEIASACQEQSRGINEITRAMTQLDQVTQQNASASQQSASAAEQLSQQAETLRASAMELMQLINGRAQVGMVYQQPHAVHRPHTAAAKRKPTQLAGKTRKKAPGSADGVPNAQHEGFDEAA